MRNILLLSAAACAVFGSVALAAPVTALPHNYTPKPLAEKVRYCTTNCYPTYGGGQTCTTQCF